MAEAKHTPGPWEVFGGYLIRALAGAKAAIPVADVRTPYRFGIGLARGDSEAAANASLIAAAPELLAKLRRVCTWLEKLAEAAEGNARTCNHQTLTEAFQADAKNYRATADDLRLTIAKAEGR